MADCSASACRLTDKQVKLWDLETDKLMTTFDAHEGGVYDVAFSPDGSILASCGEDNLVKLWDIWASRELASLRGHLKRVDAVEFSPDGRFVASTGLDGTVRIWNVTERTLHRTLKIPAWKLHELTRPNPGRTLAFTRDGSLLACGCGDGEEAVIIWEFNNSTVTVN